MALIRFVNGYAKMADAKLLQLANYVLTQMNGNPAFPTPSPSLADVQVSIGNFANLITAAKTGDRMKIALKNEAKEALTDTLHLLGAYVAFASQGSLSVAQSSGLRLVKPPAPAPPLGIPQNLEVAYTGQAGTLKSSVDSVAEAVSYLHQYTADPELKEESWQTINSTQRKCTIAGLASGTTYYFRVAAIGRKEQVMYSDVLSRVAA